jgi:hypothetical protein
MTTNSMRSCKKLRFPFLVHGVMIAAIVMLSSAAAWSQVPPPKTPSRTSTINDKPDGDVDFSQRERDMQTRLILRAEKKAYEEHLARAREARQLASDLETSFESRNSFTPEDQKRLERLEKLTRRIRNEVGGSDSDSKPDDLPTEVGKAVAEIAEMSKDLAKLVEKTPRRVLSATIIDHANKLIDVIQFVRIKTRLTND